MPEKDILTPSEPDYREEWAGRASYHRKATPHFERDRGGNMSYPA
jgi:hypothetical protein